MPLTLDADTSKRFMIIMETMGYLLIYFLNKPKQVKHVIGYVAMVHKDMDITRADMTVIYILFKKKKYYIYMIHCYCFLL